ncbi:MAG: flavodoxin family protein [Deltaproteobacteria bacterium]|nr:flavodoxin family protein [Deltaproteobacteria bacterium]MBW1987288.1 flavodoxin family protein [Deltaproteobacteria bacterium]MBW2135146.1 flavodoxin family protein [Deltaproteobacteria bacterium]
MDVLAISGSARAAGNTQYLLNHALQVLQQHSFTTALISLHNKHILPCTACLQCAEEKNVCILADDFMPIYEQMRQAKALLIGSPVYFGSASPNIMALLDRAGYLARLGDNIFYRKIGAPVVVARRAGVNFTYAQLMFFFSIMGMVVPGSSYWPIAYGHQPGEVAQDDEGLKTISDLAENIAWLLQKLR